MAIAKSLIANGTVSGRCVIDKLGFVTKRDMTVRKHNERVLQNQWLLLHERDI